MTKEEIIAAIRECAQRLGHTPTRAELVGAVKGITRYDIQRHFGGYIGALRACELNTTGRGRLAELQDLFLEWAGMTRRLGRVPTITYYDWHSRFSVRPLLNRFGNWRNVPSGLRVYAEQNGLAGEWQDVLDLVAAWESTRAETAERLKAAQPDPLRPRINAPRVLADRPVFGPPLLPSALAHGPTNESGVIYLFGTMACRLGFVVTQIQTGFPDCEAMREVERDRWQRVRIEFEYESRNFLKHCHRPEECDLIVCWTHNWPDCPLDVVELRSAVAG